MRKIVMITLAGTFLISGCVQSVDNRHKIEVSGSADSIVTPDIIYVGISLKEFFNSKTKVPIEALEKQLHAAVLKAGIPKENITINNVSSFNYANERRKNPAFTARKQYRIKVKDLNKFNQIMSDMDPRSIEYTNIDGYDYSKLEAIKQGLKVKALKAAKEKARLLAAAVDDEVGEALEINEIDNGFTQRMNGIGSVMREESAMAVSQSSNMPDIDFKNIKLNFTIRAVFELK